MSKSKQTNKPEDDDWEYFDDCPICQAMKEGRANTVEEIKEAAREVKRKGLGLVYIEGEDDELLPTTKREK